MMFKWLPLALLVVSTVTMAVDATDTRFSHTVYLQPYSKLRQAAEMGDPEAQYDLAYLYYKADSDPAIHGVIQSDDRAAHWYRKAAQQGHSRAQYNMAVLHLQGHGVTRDPVDAYAWLLLSSRQGHEPSKELIAELDGILNEQQLQTARERSSKLGVVKSPS
jgi:TPR repeat protein